MTGFWQKDQIMVISRPKLSQFKAAGFRQVSGGSLAALSLTDHTVYFSFGK